MTLMKTVDQLEFGMSITQNVIIMAHFATPNVFYRPDFHKTTFRYKGVRFFW